MDEETRFRPFDALILVGVSVLVGVIAVNLVTVVTGVLMVPELDFGSFSAPQRFVLLLTVSFQALAIGGGGWGAYRSIRSGGLDQAGLWVFFLVSCFDARGLVTRPILPVNLSFTFEFAEGASLGINLLGILLFAVFRTRLGRQPRVSAGEQALHRGAI